ncbi:MAG: NVEALA domain-containing protein [Paludibacter sp.]|nr:NVEALA domain-containing protein [Paludibacter sp.]
MKKAFYSLLTLVVFVTTLNVKVNNHSRQLSDITLQNIETLSYAESSEVRCYGTGSVDCPGSKVKVLYVSE